MSPRLSRFSTAIWTIIVAGVSLLFYVQNRQGITLESDLLRLLPQKEQEPARRAAREVFMRQIAQRVFVLVSADTFDTAKNVASSYQTTLMASGEFSEVFLKSEISGIENYRSFYFPFREQLLSDSLHSMLTSATPVEKLQQRLARILYSPLSGTVTQDISQDPLLLFSDFLNSLPQPPGKLGIREGYLTLHKDDQEFILLYAILKSNVFSRTAQVSAAQALELADQRALAITPEAHIVHAGALQFAKAMASASEKDLSVIGWGSFVGTALLVILTFFSLPPLLMSMLTVSVGILFAFSLSLLVFPYLHVLTLGFGASLIGVCADYAFHFFCHRHTSSGADSQSVLHSILPGISVGVFTSVLGYLGLFIAPFPGLSQMAFFAIVGMLASFCCVVFWFPLLPRKKKIEKSAFLLRFSQRWLAACQSSAVRKRLKILAILLSPIVLLGLLRVRIDDDVRLLQKPPAEVVQQEQKFRQIIGNFDSSRFFLISAESQDQLLEREELLTSQLREITDQKTNSGFQAISVFVPSLSKQRRNFESVKSILLSHQERLLQDLTELSINSEVLSNYFQRLQSLEFHPLLLNDWLQSPISNTLKFLWIGDQAGKCFSIVSLTGAYDFEKLSQIASQVPGASLVDTVKEVSQVLAAYRYHASLFIGLFYLAIYVFLIWRYGLSSANWGMLPAVTSVVLIVAVQGIINEPLNLFNILAVVIVLGLAIDYSVFLLEGMNSQGPTMMAIVLSTLSTILSFGLLALSSTAVLRSFGISLFTGVAIAMILAPLVIPRGNSDA